MDTGYFKSILVNCPEDPDDASIDSIHSMNIKYQKYLNSSTVRQNSLIRMDEDAISNSRRIRGGHSTDIALRLESYSSGHQSLGFS